MKYMIVKSLIATTIISNQMQLDKELKKTKEFIQHYQIDIFNTLKISHKSFDFDFKLPKKLKFELDLYSDTPIEDVKLHYDKFEKIIFHVDYVQKDTIKNCILLIKNLNKKVGLGINPTTNIEKLLPFLFELDTVLVATGTPGGFGGGFNNNMLDRIKKLRQINKAIDIEVDVGINDKTIKLCKNAGANMFVTGSFVGKSDNPKQAYNILLQAIGE